MLKSRIFKNNGTSLARHKSSYIEKNNMPNADNAVTARNIFSIIVFLFKGFK